MNTFHYIDDNVLLLELFEAIIDNNSQRAMTFSCPLEYISYSESPAYEAPIAIFTDVQMPGLSGYALIDKIRQRFPQQKFVTLSGFDETQQDGHKFACMHIHKPFNPNALERIMKILTYCDQAGAETAGETCKQLHDHERCMDGEWRCPQQERCSAQTR